MHSSRGSVCADAGSNAMAQAGAVAVVVTNGYSCNSEDPMANKKHKLSKRAKRLIAAYAHEVSDHREWRNEHNVARTYAELEAYVAELEAWKAGVARHVILGR